MKRGDEEKWNEKRKVNSRGGRKGKGRGGRKGKGRGSDG